MADKYKYDEGYQQRIVALVLQDPVFLNEYSDVINPSYFEHSYLSSIIRITKQLFDKYNQIPSKETLIEHIRQFCDDHSINSDIRVSISNKITDIYNINLTDRDIVKDEVVKFGQNQAFKKGILQIADLVENEDGFQEARDIIDSALIVGMNSNDLGIDFFRNLNGARVKDIVGKIVGSKYKIATGIPTFDRCVFGGPGKKEVWVILGYPGYGKSQCLVCFGCAALDAGESVVHITIGDLKEEDVFIRYMANRTYSDQNDVVSMSENFMRRLEKIQRYTDQYLKIKYYSSGTATPRTVRAYLNRLYSSEGIKPGLLIVDYPDEFKKYSTDMYQNMGDQYSELSAIADDFNCLVWVASQVQRQDMKNPDRIIRISNIAESWKKGQKADGVISLNRTDEERSNGKARIWVDKVRRGVDSKLINVDVDWSCCTLSESFTQNDIDPDLI